MARLTKLPGPRRPWRSTSCRSDPREGQPATFDTEVRVLYDDDSLYFGVFAKDEEPSRIIVNDLKKDYNTEGSDGFRIILDTFHDERNGYQFATNPAGAKWDAQMSNEGRETNANWDGIWEVATRITETGWIAEIRIPFRTLKFNSAEAQTWGMNFERKVRRLNEDSFWSPIPRIYDITRVSLAGTVDGLRGLRPGRNIRVKPYALSSSNTVGRLGTDGDFDAGLDVKYGVTSGLTWDFTVNTDFSQAEADEQQINLSRFSLFFPEKRDFFLENSGIFQFGAAAAAAGVGGGGARTRRRHATVLQPSHRSLRRRRRSSHPRRDAPHGTPGRLFDRRVEHAAAIARTRCRQPISRRCACGGTCWRIPTLAPSC